MRKAALVVALVCATAGSGAERQVYFGDLHIHTRYSFDAFLFGTRTDPDDAYAFARGEPLRHPSGFDVQLSRALDFYAVTDHGFYLGMWSAMTDPAHPLHGDPDARTYLDAKTTPERSRAFRTAGQFLTDNFSEADVRSAWAEIVASANRNYTPGELTTFIAYEYTSSYPTDRGNLHRNVVFRGDTAPSMPFSRLDSLNPEDLWAWMDLQRQRGMDVISIPHNSNGSNGRMFALTQTDGTPIDAAYATRRMRNEPLIENTQIKGTSDTHPFLSPNDEWADFEIMPHRVATLLRSRPQGSYAREAWRNGLVMQERDGLNPYRFGVVGSSDTHNSGDVFDEDRFVSKVGTLDSDPVGRGSVPVNPAEEIPGYREGSNIYFGASGLAAAWADENSRSALFDAFRRRETYSTTGTWIRLRFFGGYGLSEDMLDAASVSQAYASGVPMGGDLVRQESGAPGFLVWAAQDPQAAKLQRLQIVKGWVADNRSHEQVYDVACSDGLAVDPDTHRCPDNGAIVDISDCSITEGVGASELSALWHDPYFDPDQRAFYYVRVLENPTCRWSTWDAVRAGTAPRGSVPATIQERAFSSPIWYDPAG
ncbi:MAG: DUF3604 domain-containing protein [Gammaproteobacteria bacterium]|nr:DUF3604 domain-containing protein [Gammaproteobacteria bacterium]